MLPTPSTSHVSFDRVYEPAEDSYLLLDILSSESETAFLRERLSPGPDGSSPSPLILEVGTGSGVVLAFVAGNAKPILGRSDALILGTDANSFACTATGKTLQDATSEAQTDAAQHLDQVQADLATPLRSHSVDVLIFNPPYVPTEALPQLATPPSTDAFERDSHLLSLSYAGGVDGMETTNRLLDELPALLSRRGVAYVLLCAQNKPEKVKGSIRLWGNGWSTQTVGMSGKVGGWEKLSIIRIWRA